jgi:hypothetical protein
MEVSFIEQILETGEPKMSPLERRRYEFKQIINEPQLANYNFWDLPLSVIETIIKYRQELCVFCLNGANLLIEDGVLTQAFCDSCRVKLARHNRCQQCRKKCWIDKLGFSTGLCKSCFTKKSIKVPGKDFDDWSCPICFNTNFSFRGQCNRCEYRRGFPMKEKERN